MKSRVFKVNLKDEEGDPLPEKLRDTVVSTFLFFVLFCFPKSIRNAD